MSLQAMMTLAFLMASILAVSLPRPLLAPVTMNTLPVCILPLQHRPQVQAASARTKQSVATSGTTTVSTAGMMRSTFRAHWRSELTKQDHDDDEHQGNCNCMTWLFAQSEPVRPAPTPHRSSGGRPDTGRGLPQAALSSKIRPENRGVRNIDWKNVQLQNYVEQTP